MTNIIIEINQHETSQASDIDAMIYHFKDVIDEEDDVKDLSQPALVEMNSASLAKFPAYTMTGVVVSKEKMKSVLPTDWEQTPQTVNVETMIYQLVIRIKNVETDLCVRINIPLKELEGESGSKEVDLGNESINKIIESLEVVDFGLFSG